MTKIIAITNNKGGVGKTTTALNIAGALAMLGYKVLLIDLDSQTNLSSCFGVEPAPSHHIGSFVLKESTFEQTLVTHNGIDILPSSVQLNASEEKLANKARRDDKLRQAIDTIPTQYDFILIDCPPNLGLLTTNAIFAAQYYITPIEAGTFSYQGIGKLIDRINDLNDDGASIRLLGILIIKYHQNLRGAMKKGIITAIRNNLGSQVFEHYVRIDANIDKAQLSQQTIFQFAPDSNAATDYLNITHELINRL